MPRGAHPFSFRGPICRYVERDARRRRTIVAAFAGRQSIRPLDSPVHQFTHVLPCPYGNRELGANTVLERLPVGRPIAFDGELKGLELAWREAEEVAAIADDLLLPERIRRGLGGTAATDSAFEPPPSIHRTRADHAPYRLAAVPWRAGFRPRPFWFPSRAEIAGSRETSDRSDEQRSSP